MHHDVHRYLDGELPRSALTAAAEAELAEWESLEDALAHRRTEVAVPGIEARVMEALPASRIPLMRLAWRWLTTPRPVQVRPLIPLAAGLTTAALLFVIGGPIAPSPEDGVMIQEEVPSLIYAQFTLKAIGAQSVAVAGDFNQWSPEANLLRETGENGVWTGLIAVSAGVHKYMFVVDGSEWVTDPAAEAYIDDGFGMRNAVVAVAPPSPSRPSS